MFVREQHSMELHHGNAVLDRQIELEHEEVESCELELGQRRFAVGRFDDDHVLVLDQRAERMTHVVALVGHQHPPT